MSFIEQTSFPAPFYPVPKKQALDTLPLGEAKPTHQHVTSTYTKAIQKFVEFLRKHKLRVLALILGTLLLEPWQAIKAGFSFASWKKHFNFHEMNPKALTAEQLKQQPILLIHGNLHNQSAWLSLAKKLKNNYLGPVYTVNLPSGRITHKDFEIIQRKIEQIKEQYKQDIKINIVGHSRGGNIARHLALTKTNIGKVITLGAAFTQDEINALDPQFRHRIFDITGSHDILVTNPSLLPLQNQATILTGHLGLLYSSKVHKHVIEWLKH